MSELTRLLTTAPAREPAPPQWFTPDLIVLDDLTGPATLRQFAETFGRHTAPASRDRVVVTSSVDPSNTWDARRLAHEALKAFAEAWNLPFIHDAGACVEDCPTPFEAMRGAIVLTGSAPSPDVAARGGVSVRGQAEDLAYALGTGKAWVRRPAVQLIRLYGSLSAGVTVHDLAIAIRARLDHHAWLLVDWRLSIREEDAPRTLAGLLLRDSHASLVTIDNVETSASHIDAESIDIDAATLRPLIGDASGAALNVDDCEPGRIHRVYIGSCATGSVSDLRLAAIELVGQRVTVPTVVSPASERDVELLTVERVDPDDLTSPTLAEALQSAGCDIALPGCAGCVNAIADAFDRDAAPDGLTVVATAVANVSARRVARVFTASPSTAARAAIAGSMTACKQGGLTPSP